MQVPARTLQAPDRTTPLIANVIYRLDVGGLENGLVNLINRTPPERYRHAVICLTDASDFRQRITRADVPIVALNKRPGKDPALYVRLWRAVRALRPAILHTRNLGTLEAVLPAALAGVHYRVHGLHGWDTGDLHGTSRRYNLLRRLLRPFVTHYVAVSKDLELWLQQRIGVRGGDVTQIYNGVDADRFHPSRGGREPLPVAGFAPPGSFVIGNVGRMSDIKDQLGLVRAFLALLEQRPETRARLRLVIAGDGPEREAVIAALAAGEAADLAWLPGARADIPRILRGLDLFVLPSLNEGISNTILEAMATGLPVVASDVGGNPELVVSGETGTLVAPAQPLLLARAIAAYLDQPEQQRAHGAAGRLRVLEHFSLDAMLAAYLRVYDAVLGVNETARAA